MRIRTRFPSKCVECGKAIPKGVDVEWNPRLKTVVCLDCWFAEPDMGPPERDFPPENEPIVVYDEPDEPLICGECNRQVTHLVGGACSSCNMEYHQGVQDVETWRLRTALYGEDAAARMELEDELRRGWDY